MHSVNDRDVLLIFCGTDHPRYAKSVFQGKQTTSSLLTTPVIESHAVKKLNYTNG